MKTALEQENLDRQKQSHSNIGGKLARLPSEKKKKSVEIRASSGGKKKNKKKNRKGKIKLGTISQKARQTRQLCGGKSDSSNEKLASKAQETKQNSSRMPKKERELEIGRRTKKKLLKRDSHADRSKVGPPPEEKSPSKRALGARRSSF